MTEHLFNRAVYAIQGLSPIMHRPVSRQRVKDLPYPDRFQFAWNITISSLNVISIYSK